MINFQRRIVAIIMMAGSAIVQLGCSTGDPTAYLEYATYTALNCCKSPQCVESITVPVKVTGSFTGPWYGVVKLTNVSTDVEICSDPIAFNTETNLVFSGISADEGDYDLGTYLFDNFESANECNITEVRDEIVFFKALTVGSSGQCGGPTFTNHLNIEYDCMVDFDIQFTDALSVRLIQKFAAASTELQLHADATHIPNEEISNSSRLRTLLNQNYLTSFQAGSKIDSLYVFSIEDVWPREGFLPFPGHENDLIGAGGVTFGYPELLGQPGSQSVIFTEFLDDSYESEDFQEVCLITVTHELGHGRAALSHQNPDPTVNDPNHTYGVKCAMVRQVPRDYKDRIIPGYNNFCPVCLQKLEAVTW